MTTDSTNEAKDNDAGLSGLRVCSLESRKGSEMRSLVERQGGIATIAPSMQEIPLDDNPAAFAFAERLFAGEIDVLILLTGVGTRALGLLIAGTVMGSVLFRLLVAIALRWGLNPNDLKLITAVFVFAALVMPDLVRRLRPRNRARANAA